MTQENKGIIIKRLKSLAWRAGMMLVALSVDFALQNLGIFELPGQAIVIIGLVLGEVSKYLNTQAK